MYKRCTNEENSYCLFDRNDDPDGCRHGGAGFGCGIGTSDLQREHRMGGHLYRIGIHHDPWCGLVLRRHAEETEHDIDHGADPRGHRDHDTVMGHRRIHPGLRRRGNDRR